VQKIQIFYLFTLHTDGHVSIIFGQIRVSLNREVLLCFPFRHCHIRIVNVTTPRPTGYNFVCLGHDISQFFSILSWVFSVNEKSFLIAPKIIPRPSSSAIIQFNKTIDKPQMSHSRVQCHCWTFSAAVSYLRGPGFIFRQVYRPNSVQILTRHSGFFHNSPPANSR
jgi:hypothetical protein